MGKFVISVLTAGLLLAVWVGIFALKTATKIAFRVGVKQAIHQVYREYIR